MQRLDEDLKRYEDEKANAPIAPPKVPKPPVARQMKEKRAAIQQVDKRSARKNPSYSVTIIQRTLHRNKINDLEHKDKKNKKNSKRRNSLLHLVQRLLGSVR